MKYHSLYYLLKQRRLHHINTLLKERGAYWNFEKIMAIESQYDVRSTFFFLNEQDLFTDRPLRSLLDPHEWVRYYSSYRVSDPIVVDIMKQLDKQSWEIALHGSFESYERKDMLLKEKRILEGALGKPVVGVRQHYLNLQIPSTWELQRDTGFAYDSSYGACRLVEAREEWMRPFHPFETDFLIMPVTIMDRYLFRMCPSFDLAWEKCQDILRVARKNHGVVTVVWHSWQFNEQEFPGWTKIYEKLILEGKRMNAWIGPCRQVYEVLSRSAKFE
jgi:peptidoglycan/xylan/chitin deacetylase (PgdA/CDA1 family)